MAVKQVFNKKIGAYVKYEIIKKGKRTLTKIVNVKQKKPTEPFKNIPITKRKRR